MSIRLLAALAAAAVAWFALALQAGLIVDRMTGEGASVAAALWRFFGFFTILTNCAVAIVATAMAFFPQGRLAGPRLRLTVVASILLVGVVYSLALRAIWNPTGWQAVADHALHDVTPPLFLVAWLVSSHGGLGWRDALVAVSAPLGYCVYAFARGAADGWYAYWFLDPTRLGALEMVRNIVLLAVLFWGFALVLVAIDRWIAGRREVRR